MSRFSKFTDNLSFGEIADKKSLDLELREERSIMAVFTDDLNTALKPANAQVSLATDSISTKNEFKRWLTEGNARKDTYEILSCMDRISEYAVRKKITAVSLWEYVKHNTFAPVYKRLIETKMLRITDRNTYKVFTIAGRLYMQFLKNKPFARKELVALISDGVEEKRSVVPRQKFKHIIDSEDVIAWLVMQSNAHGTLYLENVVRQYMSALRTTPAKLDIPVTMNVRSVFTCQSPNEFDVYCKIYRSAPNYKQVNSNTSGMFSAALTCYMRYLQYLTDGIQVDERINIHDVQLDAQRLVSTDKPQEFDGIRYVDFNCPDLCAQSKPVTCSINGQLIILRKQNWSQLLVAITERFISEENSNLASLEHDSVYGNKAFFLSQKSDLGTCAQLSTGKWIYVNYNPRTIVTIIGNLCRYCGVNLDDVVINFQSKGDKGIVAVRTFVQPTHSSQTEMSRIILDPSVIEQLTSVLSVHYTNGFRLNSPIEATRFRLFAATDLNEELALGDGELTAYIVACGTTYEGKVYAVSAAVKERIKGLVDSYFVEGAQSIFFAEFYAKNEDWLFASSVISEDMLVVILYGMFPALSFTQTYFGYTSAAVFTALEDEILRVWDEDTLLDYDQISKRLPYVPLERIKYLLGQNGNFIWNSVETFSHVSRIVVIDSEREAIRTIAAQECNVRGYASITDLPYGEIGERNYELSITAVHNAVYQICLSDAFDKRGKIITRKGDVFNARTIMKEFCRSIDKCTLDDLLNYEKELTGEVHRWTPMEAGNTILIRIDKENYVADRFVYFDSNMIDDAIELVVTGDYLPLKSFTAFGAFPECGHAWNLFLLESYCRRFSRKFRFDTPSVNSRNAGAIIRRSCLLDYTQIMTDAVTNADILLIKSNVGRFLYDSGYTGRSTTALATEIIEKAKATIERRD